MALKDKLMTLEDFKAVRDVDVASNSAQFTEIKADLNYGKTAQPGYVLTASNSGNGTQWSPVGAPTDAQVDNAVSDWLTVHPEATTTVQDGAITDSKLSNSLNTSVNKNYVIIAALKTIYPSYTDDQLLEEAIGLAKEKGGSTVIIWDGTDIYFSGTTEHELSGFGGIDFNGSVIHMPDHDTGCILNIVPDSTNDVTVPYTDLTAYATTNAGLKGKIFKLNDIQSGNASMCLGDRTGTGFSGVTLYSSPTVYTTPDGFFATGALYVAPASGTVTCHNVHDYPNITFEICNAHVASNAGDKMTTFIRCSRSNVHIHHISLSGQSNITSYHEGIMAISGCYDVEIDHITGENPVKLSLTSGYVIGLFSVSKAYVHDINTGHGAVDSWGSIGSNHLTNTVFERCNINRWDCHYAQYGINVVRDCVLNEIKYGIGYGELLFENCTIIEKRTSNSMIYMIQQRSDCVGVFDGDIIVRGCIFQVSYQPASLTGIWTDAHYWQKTNNSSLDFSNIKRCRRIEKCIFPNDVNEIFFVGSRNSDDQGMYANMKYSICDSRISCSGVVMNGYDSNQQVDAIEITGCRNTIQCYITNLIQKCRIDISNTNMEGKTVKVRKNERQIRVQQSILKSVESDEYSNVLIVNGCVFYDASQPLGNFPNYSMYGNTQTSKANTAGLNMHYTA